MPCPWGREDSRFESTGPLRRFSAVCRGKRNDPRDKPGAFSSLHPPAGVEKSVSIPGTGPGHSATHAPWGGEKRKEPGAKPGFSSFPPRQRCPRRPAPELRSRDNPRDHSAAEGRRRPRRGARPRRPRRRRAARGAGRGHRAASRQRCVRRWPRRRVGRPVSRAKRRRPTGRCRRRPRTPPPRSVRLSSITLQQPARRTATCASRRRRRRGWRGHSFPCAAGSRRRRYASRPRDRRAPAKRFDRDT
jgi:hypothetical protein